MAPVLVALGALAVLSSGLAGCGLSAAAPCNRTGRPPTRYQHVLVLVEENRTWSGGGTPAVGLGFSARKMPFLHGLAAKCSYFRDWSETNSRQSSLTQYIGLTSGVSNPNTVNDCRPSATCQSTDNNIFRQVRNAGGTPRNYVDGATTPCSTGSNATKHIPALYYLAPQDASHCTTEVRPLRNLNPDRLPTFALITPDECNDGHDCSDSTVDGFAKRLLTRILDGASYRQGKTLVVVVYDEDRAVPNLIIAPASHRGAISSVVGSHAGLLKTVEQVLGLPVMQQGQLPGAVSLRSPANI
ncbi:alkaline phosphatase family protein [Aquihabitans sp. McL0605]|uniref:alkaline phosphatase family protein n=1 Tax=Aquihabitans sp. McL0605 TaxID=3415671 RepID=UPI003CE74D64